MTAAAELLARLEQHHITATLDPDGTVHLHGPNDDVPDRVRELVAKYEPQLRGLIAYRQHHLAAGEPAAWCNRCGTTVTQYDPDGRAWCDPCLTAHTTRIVCEAFPESEIETETTPTTSKDNSPQLTLTQTKD